MFRGRRRRTERLFEKGDADALGATDGLQGGWASTFYPSSSPQEAASRTQMTLPSSWSQASHGLFQETPFGPCWCRLLFSGSLPKARAKLRLPLSWRDPSRRDRRNAKFWPSTCRISSSRMNRIPAIQKSSRTMTMHCTRLPSHCRRACTSSVFYFSSSSHETTARTGPTPIAPFAGMSNAYPAATLPSESIRPRLLGRLGTCLLQAA